MQHNYLLAVVCLFLLGTVRAQQEQGQNKLALIVAISNYKPGTGWNPLASEKDIPLIKEALKKQGFKEQNIVVLKDAQATKEGILNGIQKYLIEKAKPGDICVFHFSGHGQQVYDDNGDEADGYDEALVTYDSPMDYVPGVERHLRDDAFGLKLEEVRQKLGEGGELIVLVDACHSGTSTRSNQSKFRGTATKYAPQNYKAAASVKTNKVDDRLFGLGDRKSGYSPMIAFFASASMELNSQVTIQGEDFGSLSMAFFKIINNASGQMSYKTIADQIKIQMKTWGLTQHPDAEGELDKEIFGGNLLAKSDYYIPGSVKGKEITISTGKIYNVFEGTTVKIYPADTRDTFEVKPLATGTIVTAGDFSSTVQLNEPMEETKLANSWVYLDEINFGSLQTGIFLKNLQEEARQKLIQSLVRVKEVKLSEATADLTVEVKSSTNGEVYSFQHRGEAFLELPVSTDEGKLTDTLRYRLRHYAWSRYFMNFQKVDTNIRTTFRILPLKVVKRNERGAIVETQDLPENTIKDKNGNFTLTVGDAYNLEFTNSGQERCYFTLLEIQPDNLVNSLMPGYRINEDPKQYFMEPDQTIRHPKVFSIGPPYGTNRLLLITSREPLDYRPFLKKPDKTKTRGSGDEGGVEMDVMNTFYIDYQIVPKKQ
jgi:hypothetical protein